MTPRDKTRAKQLKALGYTVKGIAGVVKVNESEVREALSGKRKPAAKPRRRKQLAYRIGLVQEELERGADPDVVRANWPDEMELLEENKC